MTPSFKYLYSIKIYCKIQVIYSAPFLAKCAYHFECGSETITPASINKNHTKIKFCQPICDTAFAKSVLDTAAAI